MQRLVLLLAAAGALLYVLLATRSWLRSRRVPRGPSASARPSYIWGFLFAVIFYFGFPLWWWRYGLSKALQLMLVCIGGGMLIQVALRTMDAVEVNGLPGAIAVGLFIAVPIRAVAGLWVARRDASWRAAIVARRDARNFRDIVGPNSRTRRR